MEFDEWIADHSAEAIGPTLELFNAAKTNGVAIFFISSRREDQRSATVKNLKTAGYDGWTDLFLKQPDDKSSSREFKTATRKRIEDRFTIIAHVGDEYSDLTGGHAEPSVQGAKSLLFYPLRTDRNTTLVSADRASQRWTDRTSSNSSADCTLSEWRHYPMSDDEKVNRRDVMVKTVGAASALAGATLTPALAQTPLPPGFDAQAPLLRNWDQRLRSVVQVNFR